MFQFKPVFTLDDAAIDVMINQPQGEVGRWMRRKGRQMEAAAKRDVPVKTGRLRASIYRTHERVSRGQQMVIGARADHALMMHEGTKPHIIVGPVGKMLVFRKGGKTFRVHGVRHPGTEPTKFLTKQFVFLKLP